MSSPSDDHAPRDAVALARPGEDAGASTDDASDGVLVIRRGPGANCSSIGSAVEMLFLSATVGAAVLAAVVAALRPRPPEAVDAHRDEPPPPSDAKPAREDDPSEAG